MGALPRRAGILTTMGATLALAISLLTLGAPQAARADSPAIATITGTVTAETGGAPLTFPQITLYVRSGSSWKFYDFTSGGRDGTYQFQNLPVGTYTLEFSPEHGDNFVTEWWNNASTETAATTITVGTATTTVTADTALATGATISGTITSPATSTFALVPDMELLASDGKGGFQDAGLWAYPTQNGDGQYSIVGVPPGEYTVYFGDDASQSDIAPLYYGEGTAGTPNEWDATPFSVAAGETITGIDATFVHGATVTGKVTDYWGNPLSNVTVDLGRRVTINGTAEWDVSSVTTNSSGSYRATALIPGSWVTTFAKSGYTATLSPASGTFGLTSGQQKSMPTMKLYRTLTSSTPTITGTVRVGYRLTAHAGTWTSGTTLTYAWYANGAYISGSVGHATFTLGSAQRGKTITVKVTGRKSGYTTLTRVSRATAKVG